MQWTVVIGSVQNGTVRACNKRPYVGTVVAGCPQLRKRPWICPGVVMICGPTYDLRLLCASANIDHLESTMIRKFRESDMEAVLAVWLEASIKSHDFVELTLSVYRQNEASCQFYLSQGFHIVSEQTDEHTGHLEFIMSTDS